MIGKKKHRDLHLKRARWVTCQLSCFTTGTNRSLHSCFCAAFKIPLKSHKASVQLHFTLLLTGNKTSDADNNTKLKLKNTKLVFSFSSSIINVLGSFFYTSTKNTIFTVMLTTLSFIYLSPVTFYIWVKTQRI